MKKQLKKIIQFYNLRKLRNTKCEINIFSKNSLLENFRIFTNPKGLGKITIKKNCFIDCSLHLETPKAEILIGENCHIQAQTKIISAKKILIGNNVTISWGVTLIDTNANIVNPNYRKKLMTNINLNHLEFKDPYKDINWDDIETKEIILQDNVLIGFNSIILKGVEIGRNSIVGAGSVVTNSIPSNSIYAGNPAKFVQKI